MNSDDLLIKARNAVLRHNPPVAANNITTRGSNWLWAVFTIMLICTLAAIGATVGVKRHVSPRLHYLAITILMVSTLAYFTMASNLGGTPVTEEFMRGGDRPGPTREIFYVRWIEYFITFSLEIFALLAIARTSWSTRLFVVAMTMFMIVCHLSGALVVSRYKWGYFVFGLLGYILVAWRTFTDSNRGSADAEPVGEHHHNTGGTVGRKHHGLVAYLLALWLFYPICWGVSEAGNVISLDGECIFYGILDILTKPVFLVLLLMSAREGTHHGTTATGTGTRKNRLWNRKTTADTAV
jgi:bacteriorhodopsin